MPLSRNRRGRSGRRVPRAVEPVRGSRRSSTNKFYLLASIVIAVLVIASFAFASFSGGPSSPGSEGVTPGISSAYVDGVGTKVEELPTRYHLDGENIEYNSVPATSGDHWEVPQPCGFYETEIPDEIAVHNLEHSNIVISHNLQSQEEVGSLRDAFDDLGAEAQTFGVARRYSKIAPGQVALSAWGVYDVMQGVDKDRIERFFEHYLGTLGPEGAIPCSRAQQSMPAG